MKQSRRWSVAAPGLAGKLYVIGGECREGRTFPQSEAYDPKSGRWRALTPLPHGRHGFGAADVDGVVYVAGGAEGCGGRDVTDEILALHWR